MPHLKLGDIEAKEIFAGHRARLIHGDRMTVAYYDITADARAPEHDHPHEQIVNILSGEYELTVAGEKHVLEPGSVFVVPSGVRHAGHAITDCRIMDVFSPVREDYVAK
jgi:quercetin dioxygenase-like cupin family protein